MKLNLIFFYFIVATIIALSSCSENDQTQESDPENTPTPNPMEVPDIYFILHDGNGTESVKKVEQVWKNEEVLYDQLGYVQFIYVSENNDIYMAGKIDNNVVVWKNGEILYEIANQYDETNSISSMYINGEDLYLGGYSLREYDWYFTPVVWKNGKKLFSYDGSSYQQPAISAIQVYNKDMYVVCEDQKGIIPIATVWKNQQKLYELPCNRASTIYISANDIYVTGNTRSITNQSTHIFKNEKMLYSIPDIGNAKSFFYENSIFTVGYDVRHNDKAPIAQIWKNDHKLYDLPYRAEPKTIFIYKGDVYTAGNSFNVNKDRYIAYIWKNDKILYQFTYGKGSVADIRNIFIK